MAKLISCDTCGKQVASSVESCVHCGGPIQYSNDEARGLAEKILEHVPNSDIDGRVLVRWDGDSVTVEKARHQPMRSFLRHGAFLFLGQAALWILIVVLNSADVSSVVVDPLMLMVLILPPITVPWLVCAGLYNFYVHIRKSNSDSMGVAAPDNKYKRKVFAIEMDAAKHSWYSNDDEYWVPIKKFVESLYPEIKRANAPT